MRTDPPDLLAVVREPHTRVLAALDDPERTGFVAVAWCSAHLAAVDQLLYTAVHRRAAGSVRDLLRAARQQDHLLQQAVFRLDRRLTGDVHVAHLPIERLADDVREALQEHATREGRLVRALEALMAPEEQQALADALPAATTEAPTRPHPHTRHTPLAGLVGRVDAGVDRVRDVLDNRVPSLGRRTRPVRPMSRWGAYLTASPYPDEPRSPTAEQLR